VRKNPIVGQVRSIRWEIEQKYPDAELFYKHLEQQQEPYRKHLTRRNPKKPPHTKAC